jgi:hypothetical protein
MNLLAKVFHKLRGWMGLADPSESHLTPRLPSSRSPEVLAGFVPYIA